MNWEPNLENTASLGWKGQLFVKFDCSYSFLVNLRSVKDLFETDIAEAINIDLTFRILTNSGPYLPR